MDKGLIEHLNTPISDQTSSEWFDVLEEYSNQDYFYQKLINILIIGQNELARKASVFLKTGIKKALESNQFEIQKFLLLLNYDFDDYCCSNITAAFQVFYDAYINKSEIDQYINCILEDHINNLVLFITNCILEDHINDDLAFKVLTLYSDELITFESSISFTLISNIIFNLSCLNGEIKLTILSYIEPLLDKVFELFSKELVEYKLLIKSILVYFNSFNEKYYNLEANKKNIYSIILNFLDEHVISNEASSLLYIIFHHYRYFDVEITNRMITLMVLINNEAFLNGKQNEDEIKEEITIIGLFSNRDNFIDYIISNIINSDINLIYGVLLINMILEVFPHTNTYEYYDIFEEIIDQLMSSESYLISIKFINNLLINGYDAEHLRDYVVFLIDNFSTFDEEYKLILIEIIIRSNLIGEIDIESDLVEFLLENEENLNKYGTKFLSLFEELSVLEICDRMNLQDDNYKKIMIYYYTFDNLEGSCILSLLHNIQELINENFTHIEYEFMLYALKFIIKCLENGIDSENIIIINDKNKSLISEYENNIIWSYYKIIEIITGNSNIIINEIFDYAFKSINTNINILKILIFIFSHDLDVEFAFTEIKSFLELLSTNNNFVYFGFYNNNYLESLHTYLFQLLHILKVSLPDLVPYDSLNDLYEETSDKRLIEDIKLIFE